MCLPGEQPLRLVLPAPEPPAARPAAAAPTPSPGTAGVQFARLRVAGQAAVLLRLRGLERFVPQPLQVRL